MSNTRRIAFTAMALVTFWVASFGAYHLALELPSYLYVRFGAEVANGVMAHYYLWAALACSVLVALIPAVFLLLSRHNSPIKLGDHHILIGWLLFATCIGYCHWVGERDLREPRELLPHPTHHGLLLLPLILASALTIFGAWRHAVRVDADH